jgi:hypothetical protein
MRWDLYEEISDQACRTNFAGRLTTEDGVEITFDAVGFGLVPDAEKAQRWYMAYAVHFQSSASKYGWLSAVLGLWEGWLDMQSYTHHYQVFANETLLPSQ